MRPKHHWAALAIGLPITLVTASAGAETGSALVALCPVGDSAARAAPTCTAVRLLSARGYLVLPGARVRVGISGERVNVMLRLAIF